ncbi:MAG: CinA family nicotinamide mononucleotide deamidase-related protein [Marinobacterium sp.]|nr:CinA family nicotinamide mononucleotide deamidase-related protein [Marinobacterium sp.]
MNIQLLLTGNELMNGDVVDSNSAMIADELKQLGLAVSRKVTVGDEMGMLVDEMERLSSSADLLLVNGGLGPTVDDLTAAALAQLCSVGLTEHSQARTHLQHWADTRGLRLNNANLKQAMLPDGAQVVPNSRGTAVGFSMRHNNCQIICTPGVPHELRAMLKEQILPALTSQVGEEHQQLLQRYHTYGQGESNLQQWIADKLPDLPECCEIGFRAGAPTLELKVQTPASEPEQHARTCHRLLELIGDYVVAEDSDSLATTLIRELSIRHQTVTFAESCTGGLISAMLTAEPGSSAVFEAGYITYANRIKQQLTGVSNADLEQHGAVSEPVVRQMALGALSASNADYAVAVSGIAGPDGGSEEKPTGTVWIAWGSTNNIRTACLLFPYRRRMFQTMVAGAALDLIRRDVMGITTQPRYLQDRQHPVIRSTIASA